MKDGVALAKTGNMPVHLDEDDVADLIVHAANTGVPLTWDEVRMFHALLETAHAGYTGLDPYIFDLFNAGAPDGDYVYKPPSGSIKFRSLALAIGSCVATYRNRTSQPLLDCDHLRQSFSP